MPRDELVGFYDAWYRPDNAAVVVVGDIDVDDMVSDIEDRFGPAVARTDEMPPRPDTTFPIETEPGFALHSDPDQPTADVEVDLPIPAIESDGTAGLRASLLDSMIYSTLIRRLDQDIVRRHGPFDQIMPGTNSFVAALDAPALVRDHDVRPRRRHTAGAARRVRARQSLRIQSGAKPTSPRVRRSPASIRSTTAVTRHRTSTTRRSTSPTSSPATPIRRRTTSTRSPRR